MTDQPTATGEATERVNAAKALERIWDAVVWDSTPNADKPGLLSVHAALVAHILAASDSSALLSRAERAEAENERLRAALILAREELNGLPRSLGYDFTHLPKIDAALRQDAPGGGA